MLQLLLQLRQYALPTANAIELEKTGDTGVGVWRMWYMIRSVLPFSGIGDMWAVVNFAGRAINFATSMVNGIAILLLIYAGIRMIVSHGSDEQYTNAKTIMFYALGGLVLGMLGQGIIFYFYCYVFPQSFGGGSCVN